MYHDYADIQAEKNIPMAMEDWAKKLNAFLQFNEKDILENAVKMTAVLRRNFLKSEFEKYPIIQDSLFQSDFDRLANSKFLLQYGAKKQAPYPLAAKKILTVKILSESSSQGMLRIVRIYKKG